MNQMTANGIKEKIWSKMDDVMADVPWYAREWVFNEAMKRTAAPENMMGLIDNIEMVIISIVVKSQGKVG